MSIQAQLLRESGFALLCRNKSNLETTSMLFCSYTYGRALKHHVRGSKMPSIYGSVFFSLIDVWRISKTSCPRQQKAKYMLRVVFFTHIQRMAEQ
jgi:hypothetical protein